MGIFVSLPALELHGEQQEAAAGQRRVWHQRDARVLPRRAQQRVQGRDPLARRRLLPPQSVRLRGMGISTTHCSHDIWS